MDLRLTTDTHDGWTILAVDGELDLHTSPQLQRALWEAIDQGAKHVALDMSDVPFMDSSSLGVIIGGLKRAREVGGDLALISLQPSPAKVVALTGLDAVFRMVDDASSLSHHDG
jgi:anti-sigma B factor antagonist